MELSSVNNSAADFARTKVDETVRKITSKNDESAGFSDELSVKIIDPKVKKPLDKKLMDTCIEMESLFVKQMFNTMRKTVEKGEMFHGGNAEDIFEDMLYDEYSLNVSKNSNLGIAKKMYEQMRDYV
ncbi:MAG: rod-binding protein [Spirochaetes bacterium]|nr:rod-binding protein [Spirochaetota bacterium]